MQKLLKIAVLVLAVAASACCAIAQMPKPGDPYVFAYFKEPGDQGIYFALSRDGYTYTPLNDGQPWILPTEPGELMRDVYITRTPDDHGFRMVFTWAWKGNSIGIASSDDLMVWTPHREVKIMSDFPQVQNTWAPETYWDNAKKQWLIVWSSSFKALPETGTPAEGLRLWSAWTGDWQTFTKPEKFFDRGFPVIDATLFHREIGGKKDVVMVFKDQTPDPLRYNERWVAGPTVEGPWGAMSGPIDASWSEGPSVIKVKDRWVVFYDHYRQPRARFEAVETADWIHWSSADDKINLPEGSKHGSFFQVTEEEAKRLLSRHDAPPATTP